MSELSGHGRWVCQYGAIHKQCRCVEGHLNATVAVVCDIADKHNPVIAEPTRPGLPPLNKDRWDIIIATALRDASPFLTYEQHVNMSNTMSKDLWKVLQTYGVVK